MSFYLKFCVIMSAIYLLRSHTHDEIAKCTLTGVYKMRQTVLESPNYPNNYKPDTCWDYVIRSPYKCPTTFHIQFLDFYLESSKDCKNDYLAIGQDNVDDDMDVLCGQVVGIKKYHTPDGILRLRFFADESPWTTGKGFKLLITRLACEEEEILRKFKHDDNADDNDTVAISVPTRKYPPPEPEIMQIFRNLTSKDQYQIVPVAPLFGLNYPTYLPSPPYPAIGTVYIPASESRGPIPNYPESNVRVQTNLQQLCSDIGQQNQLANVGSYYGTLSGNQQTNLINPFTTQANYLPSFLPLNSLNQVQPSGASNNVILTNPRDQYIGAWPSTPSVLRAYDDTYDFLESCCVSPFRQKRFYLSSPGFPRSAFSNILPNVHKRDCVFRLQKSSSNVCLLRLDFKFFDFGQNYEGTGSYYGNIGSPAIQNTQDVCTEDFIEIDDQRFCGCRSGNSYTSYWNSAGDKKIRMRMGYSGIPSGGFLLELVQEECSENQFALQNIKRPLDFTTTNPNLINNQLISAQPIQSLLQQKNLYGSRYPSQQRLPLTQNLYGGSYPVQQPQEQNLYGGSYYKGPQSFLQNNLEQSNYLPQQQQLFNTPVGFSSKLPQQNFFLNAQQPQQQHLMLNPFGLPQTRYARSFKNQAEPMPIMRVETNSTRKEYYYSSDNDSSDLNENLPSMSRSSSSDTSSSSKWDRKDTNVSEKKVFTNGGNDVSEGICSLNIRDILRLSVDILWITKPICYAPQRNWFTNWTR